MPLLSKANGLEQTSVPPELSALNELEKRLIVKMVGLPCGKKRENCVVLQSMCPVGLIIVCTVLLCLPSQSELIQFKLKRKPVYRGHYVMSEEKN